MVLTLHPTLPSQTNWPLFLIPTHQQSTFTQILNIRQTFWIQSQISASTIKLKPYSWVQGSDKHHQTQLGRKQLNCFSTAGQCLPGVTGGGWHEVLLLLSQIEFFLYLILYLTMLPVRCFKLATFDKQLSICPTAIYELKNISDSIYPVCVMGPSLSGKSTLLNQIIGDDVFPVGKTTNPLTKGLWAYPYRMAQLNCTILFIDSEGFDNAYASETQETNLILALMLLCNLLLHNSLGALDSSLIARLASISQRLPSNLRNAPRFALIQRDFSLQLVDSQGSHIEMQEYLDYSFKNLKDKKAIKLLEQTFTQSSNHKFLTEGDLSCHLLPCPGEKHKYSRRLQYMRSRILDDLRRRMTQQNLFTACQYLFRLEETMSFLQQSNKAQIIGQFQNRILSRLHKQQSTQLSTYKAHLGQHLKQTLGSQTMPIPHSLIDYQIQNASFEYFKADKYLQQLIGKKNIEEHNQKMKAKVVCDNQCKIESFIIEKSKEYFHKKQNINEGINIFVQQMLDGYAFLSSESHQHILQREYWKNQCNRIRQLLKSHELTLTQVTQSKHSEEEQKILLIKELQSERKKVFELTTECERLSQEINEVKENDLKVKEKLRDYQQMVQKNKDKEVQLCMSIQQRLRQSLTHEDYSNMQKATSAHDGEEIIKILKQLNQSINAKDSRHIETILAQQERLISLENMNKLLRVRIDQFQSKGSEVTIQKQYKQLSEQHSRFQKQTYNRIGVKDEMICQLNRKLQRNESVRGDLIKQIELMRSSLADRNKGTEFLQQLIQNKDNTIESLRTELFDTLSKFKHDLAATQSENKARASEVTETLSMFIMQNQQLKAKIAELETKLRTCSSKHKQQMAELTEDKDREIDKLKRYCEEISASIESATESYQEVTNKMQAIIRDKDDNIRTQTQQIKELQMSNHKLQKKVSECEDMLASLRSQTCHRELQRQQNESNLKREAALMENRIKHLSNQNDKLKAEMKEKCSTFEIMLLQLRGHKILGEAKKSTSDSTSIQINKLNQLQEEVLKELDLLQDHHQNLPLQTTDSKRIYSFRPNQEYQNENGLQRYSTSKKKPANLAVAENQHHFKSSFSESKTLLHSKGFNFNASTRTENYAHRLKY